MTPRFTWRVVLVALAIVLLLRMLAHASPWSLAEGRFDALESEAMECYFNVLEGVRPIATVVFPPKSEACTVARNALRGKRGRLVFIVEPD